MLGKKLNTPPHPFVIINSLLLVENVEEKFKSDVIVTNSYDDGC